MSDDRAIALWTIFKNTGCPVAFITKETLEEWIIPEYPLHEAYNYLSSTHKSDYLRCYLMHHYGGGYTDIKLTNTKWKPFFMGLENSNDNMALGYTEIALGIPHIKGEFGDQIRAAHRELIGLCAFIFKSKSTITSQWYSELHKVLDEKLSDLKNNPGKFSLDQTGLKLPSGDISLYPLRWAEILGEILHPLFYKYRNNLIKAKIEPAFIKYR